MPANDGKSMQQMEGDHSSLTEHAGEAPTFGGQDYGLLSLTGAQHLDQEPGGCPLTRLDGRLPP